MRLPSRPPRGGPSTDTRPGPETLLVLCRPLHTCTGSAASLPVILRLHTPCLDSCPQSVPGQPLQLQASAKMSLSTTIYRKWWQ